MYVSIRFHAPFGRVIRGLSLSNRSKVIYSNNLLVSRQTAENLWCTVNPLKENFFSVSNNKRIQGAIYCSGIVPPVLIMLLHLVTPRFYSVLHRFSRLHTGSTLLLCFLFLLPLLFTHTRFFFLRTLFTSILFSFFLSFFSFSYFLNETDLLFEETRKCST